MKKLLIPLLLLFCFTVKAQVSSVTPQFAGSNSVNYLRYTWSGKTGGFDTLWNQKGIIKNQTTLQPLSNFNISGFGSSKAGFKIGDSLSTTDRHLSVFRKVSTNTYQTRFGVSVFGGLFMSSILNGDTVNAKGIRYLNSNNYPESFEDGGATGHPLASIETCTGCTFDPVTRTFVVTGGGSSTNADSLGHHPPSYYLDRTNHTGSQAESTVTNLVTDLAAKVPTTRTVNGKALSSNITLGLASSDFANQGTTTTVLHGNASGNPSFAQIAIADLSATGTPSSTTYLRGDGSWVIPSGGTTNTNYASGLPLTNVTGYNAFGDSFTASYMSGSLFHGYVDRLLGIVFSTDGPVLQNYSLSGEGVWYAASQANKFLPLADRYTLKTWMAGLNDVRYAGNNAKTFLKIQSNLRSFLAACFLNNAVSGMAGTKTGIWSNYDATSVGGKSPYLTNVNAAQSTTSGSTISITTAFNEDAVVIGTFSADGVTSTLGSFEVHVINSSGLDSLYLTYNPNGRNDGTTNGTGVVKTIQPDVILLRGVESSTIKIKTTSTTNTIIDYMGKLNSASLSSPVVISSIPYMAPAGYATSPANATKAIIDTANNYIKRVVSEFSAYPVSYLDINVTYNPLTMASSDGLHPGEYGYLTMGKAFAAQLSGASRYQMNPNQDITVNGIRIGQGPQTTNGTNSNGFSAGLNAGALNTTGADNVDVGGGAGSLRTIGLQNTNIGTRAGRANAIRNNNTNVGWQANSNGTGYSNTVMGPNAQLPSSSDVDEMLIITGEGDQRFFMSTTDLKFTVAGNVQFEIIPSGATTIGRTGATVASLFGNTVHKNTPAAVNSTATLTAAQMASGHITTTSAAAETLTTSTATAIATQIGAVQGTWYDLTIDNTAGANTDTLALGSGFTQLPGVSTGLTVPSGTTGIGTWRITFVSTTAATISRIQ